MMKHSSGSGSGIGSENDDRPFKVPTSAAETETPLQTAQKYKNAGNVYFKTEKYSEAIAQYNKAIDICPKENVNDLAIFYQNRAAAYEQLKKFNCVKADCTKALELNPRYIKALLRRARVLEQIGDLEAALKDMTTACIHENFSNQTSLLKVEMVVNKLVKQHARKNSTGNLIFFILNGIEIYIRSFSKDPVFSRLEYPENIPEFFKKPLQALKHREYDNIIPLCTEIIESPEFDTLPSSKLEVLLLRATFYTFLGEHDPAIQDFEIILSNKDAFDDIRVNVLIKRAYLYLDIGIPEMTFKDFELAIIINPTCSDIYYHRGEVYLSMKELDQAKCDFEKAVEYNPNFSIAHLKKCYVNYHFAMSKRNTLKCMCLVKMAERDFEKAFEKYSNRPESICCYVLYVRIMLETQQYQKANTYFAKAIEKDLEFTIICLLMLWTNLDTTVEYLNKILKLETCSIGSKLKCCDMLRRIEICRGNVEEAIKLSDKTLAFCRTFKELLQIYSWMDNIKIHLDKKNRLECIIYFLRSYSRFIGIQNVKEPDKHISIDSDWSSKVLFSAAESETPLQRAQKYKNAGNVYFRMEKYNEAIARYNKAIDICPKENKDDLATFYQNRAAANEQLKKYDSVKADCTQALKLNPRYTKALLRRARVLEQIGDLDAALKDMTTVCIHEEFSNAISLSKVHIILKKLGEFRIKSTIL